MSSISLYPDHLVKLNNTFKISIMACLRRAWTQNTTTNNNNIE